MESNLQSQLTFVKVDTVAARHPITTTPLELPRLKQLHDASIEERPPLGHCTPRLSHAIRHIHQALDWSGE